MKRLKSFNDRWKCRKHAAWHILHGLFPNWRAAEEAVDSPDFDHVYANVGFKGKGYLKHLKINYRCAVRHLVMAMFPYFEVRIGSED